MNDQPNPYRPPQADPWPAVSGIQYPNSGTLWRIVDGKLQVQPTASLPDVAVDGSPEAAAGKRMALVVRVMPEWLYGVLWLGIAGARLAGWVSYDVFLLMFFAVAFLPGLLGKRLRVELYRSNAEITRTTVRFLVVIVILVGLLVVAPLLGWTAVSGFWEGGTLALIGVYYGVLHLFHHFRGGSLGWARNAGDGWFELKGIAPAAIARLEDLEKRMPPSLAGAISNKTP